MRKILMLAMLVAISMGNSDNKERFANALSKECKKEHSNNSYESVYCDCIVEVMMSKLSLEFSDKEFDLIMEMDDPNFRPNSLQEMDTFHKLNKRLEDEINAIISDEKAFMDYMVKCGKTKGIGTKK